MGKLRLAIVWTKVPRPHNGDVPDFGGWVAEHNISHTAAEEGEEEVAAIPKAAKLRHRANQLIVLVRSAKRLVGPKKTMYEHVYACACRSACAINHHDHTRGLCPAVTHM